MSKVEIPGPDADDLNRDLALDYEAASSEDVGTHDRDCDSYSSDDEIYLADSDVPCSCGLEEARTGWPAAIRRAVAAEAEILRLRAALMEIARERPLGPGMTEVVHGRSAQAIALAALQAAEISNV